MFGKKKEEQNTHASFESTQKFLEIDQIKDDILILKDGGLHAVLMVSSINMELRSEQEQGMIIASYQSALNSISFPLQFLVQSRKVDLTSYMASLGDAARKQQNTLLKEQTEDYIFFLESILSSVNVMDKRFFVVIPYYPNVIGESSKGLLSMLGIKKLSQGNVATENYKLSLKQLHQRVETTLSFLAEIGLTATPLPTEAIIELFYACYNPETAGHEHIKNLDSLGAKYISTRKSVEEGMEG